jgi:hypothetical protein
METPIDKTNDVAESKSKVNVDSKSAGTFGTSLWLSEDHDEFELPGHYKNLDGSDQEVKILRSKKQK